MPTHHAYIIGTICRQNKDFAGVVLSQLSRTSVIIRDLAAFAGLGYGALRTALSRAHGWGVEVLRRREWRDALRYFGFKRIAQNTYINGMIETSGLESTLRDCGIEEKLFLFRCPTIEDPKLESRLKAVFDLEGRSRILRDFLGELRVFVGEAAIDPIEFGRRMFYAGPVFHRLCFTDEPPLPDSFLPEGYPIKEFRVFFRSLMAERGGDVMAYYSHFAG